MGKIGSTELLIVLAIVLIIFGPKALPKLGRSLGKTLGSFRRGMAEDVDEDEDDAEEERVPLKQKKAITRMGTSRRRCLTGCRIARCHMIRKKKRKRERNSRACMSLVGHLREIRNRIALSFVILVAVFFACFAAIRPLAYALLQLGLQNGFEYVYLSPSELLTSYVKLALVCSFALVSPVLIAQIWGSLHRLLHAGKDGPFIPR